MALVAGAKSFYSIERQLINVRKFLFGPRVHSTTAFIARLVGLKFAACLPD